MVKLALLVLGLLSLASLGHGYGKKGAYEGYQLLQVNPTNQQQVEYAHALTEIDNELDFWHDARRVGDRTEILVPPTKVNFVRNYMKDGDLEITTLKDNMETFIAQFWSNLEARRKFRAASFEYNDWNTYDEIMAQIEVWVTECPSGFKCESYSIGKSFEGRDQKMFRIYKEGVTRRAFWIDSTIHAREWLSTGVHMKIIQHLLHNYGKDAEATRFLDAGDWYFLPVHNPDGYVWTWDEYRLWRKNRYNNTLVRDNPTNCIGVDLNRNYMHRWGNAGTNDNPCSDTYRGWYPSSEIETKNVQTEMLKLKGRLTSMMTIHTAARLILSPWGAVINPWRSVLPTCEYLKEPENTDITSVAANIAKAIQDTHAYSRAWEGGNSCETIYPASGSTCDFARGVVGVKFAFTPELRDIGETGGSYGFAPEATEIQPAFEETWNGFIAMMDGIDEYYLRNPTAAPGATTLPPTDGASSITPICGVLMAISLILNYLF